jgi:nitric oxide reductase subunit B
MIARQHWWKVLLGLLVLGAAAVLFMGLQTYQGAPPIVDFVSPSGDVVVSAESVLAGQAVFQKYALMEHGSMFGDGGCRGPDFTAEALHQTALSITRFHESKGVDPLSVPERVRREIKENRYDAAQKRIRLTESQVQAAADLKKFYVDKFTTGSFKPAGYITDRKELENLASFFYWGAWVCGTKRPGSTASYTQNWPYDELAGNTVTSGSIFWSVIGSFSLIFAVGIVLFVYGRVTKNSTAYAGEAVDPAATSERVSLSTPTPTQRATYKLFAVAAVLFLLQVLSGVLTVHDFVGFTNFFGYDIQKDLPLTIVRSWHVQLSILWISTCWIAGSIFILPRIAKGEPPHQLTLVNILFWMLVAVVGGMSVGTLMGPKGLMGEHWRLLGNQGWEFVELGKLWQGVLFASLILWAVIIYRGVRPVLSQLKPFSLPNWMLYSVVTITLLFISSFVAQPRTNFVVADFWRWMVIHMWAECFFEVFTTVVIAYYMVLMGLVSREAATRIVFIATLLFCGSGFVGISHNFYWNAKPEATLALGAIFSTMQVVPLIMLTVEAWKFRQLPENAMRDAGNGGPKPAFGLSEAFLFLIGVNFWNFFGAGVLGFIINLPVVNYYEHGTYLTVNHGHAALMGVYGNLSIAAILFCSRYLIRSEHWNGGLLRASFWSLNIGLMLMVLLDLFPAGALQLQAVLERGLWYGRSEEFIQGAPFQTLTWMRIIGGALFVIGGVVPLTWFMVARWNRLKPATVVQPTPAPAHPEAQPVVHGTE